MIKKLSIVVPIYNDEKSIVPFLNEIEKNLKHIDYELIFCLDPSSDNTESKLIEEKDKNERIKILKFSRRYGQSLAIREGIFKSSASYVVVIDVDLQDPPKLIIDMLNKIEKEKIDCVYGQRLSRKGEFFIRIILVNVYYYILNKFSLSFFEIPKNVGEFRIMSRKMVDQLKQTNRGDFLRGDIPFIGFNQASIKFDREERKYGVSKYLIGSVRGAVDGLVNFTHFFSTFALALVLIFFVLISFNLFFYIPTVIISSFGILSIILLLFFNLIYLRNINDQIKGNSKVIIEKYLE